MGFFEYLSDHPSVFYTLSAIGIILTFISAFNDLKKKAKDKLESQGFNNHISKLENEENIVVYTRENLLELSPRQFEELAANYMKSLGYEVNLTRKTADGGFDVSATKDGFVVLIECKRYKNPVGVEKVRAFHGTVQGKNADRGYIFSTAEFTKQAREHARSTRYKVRCVGVKKLLKMLNGSMALEEFDESE